MRKEGRGEVGEGGWPFEVEGDGRARYEVREERRPPKVPPEVEEESGGELFGVDP